MRSEGNFVGSTLDWLEVILSALFWGGGMLAWEYHERESNSLKPALLPACMLGWALAGLGFGLGVTFGWDAARWPLVLVSSTSFLGAVIIRARYIHERKRRKNWERMLQFLVLVATTVLLVRAKASPIAYLTLGAIGIIYLVEYFESKDRESEPLGT